MNKLSFGILIHLLVFMSGIIPIASAELLPHSLRVSENFVDPLGFYDSNPEFSWKLPANEGIQSQFAYRIVVASTSGADLDSADLWDSGKIESDQSVWVQYQGKPLGSRQQAFWKVKFWDDQGRESDWSEEARLEIGLLSNQDWDGQWIEIDREIPPPDTITILKAEYGSRDGKQSRVADVAKTLTNAIANGAALVKVVSARLGVDPAPGEEKKLWVEYEVNGSKKSEEIAELGSFSPYPTVTAQPGYVFRKEFDVSDQVVKARLYASALGIYEFHLNGKRVGTDVLAPGYTSYSKRVETLTYDVTSLVKPGANAIGALVGEGWYAGNLLLRKRKDFLGLTPKLLGQLELTYANGRVEKISTDQNWKGTDKGPIRAGGFYHGEDYDASMDLGDWSVVGYDDQAWATVVVTPIAAAPLLTPKRLPPVRVMAEKSAISISEPAPGKFVFDFGQNIVGIPTFKIPVRTGQAIQIRVAEMLEKDGTLYTENYRSARSQATYHAATNGDVVWEPSLTFFGFRFVEVSGLAADVKLTTDAVAAKVIHTDFKPSGKLASSHEKLNQLQSNIRWGQIGNFVDIPTDCPQRDERLGWTGDAQAFLPTSFFNYEVYSFWARWLQSVRDEQLPDGQVPHTVPEMPFGYSSPGWSDVIVTAPWEVYERTGDRRILIDNYEAMQKWVGVYQRDAKNYITNLKGYGDWLQPYSTNGNKGETSEELISTAYFGRDARILMWTATALGKTEDAKRFEALHSNIRQAFSKRYLESDTAPTGADTQTAFLMALAYDLAEPELREKIEARLLKKLAQVNRHLQTGFLGTPLLAPVFDQIGHPEISYELLFKESYPSWFYSINQGATTMWERWNSYSHADGFGNAGMNSFNHYAYGAIGQFMYERVAGLSLDPSQPGYKHFFIRPLIDNPLTWASAELDTPYGIAKSAWKLTPEKLTLDTIVPPNTTATVVFPMTSPDGNLAKGIRVNGAELNESKWATEVRLDQAGQAMVTVGAGKFQFELPLIAQGVGKPAVNDANVIEAKPSEWRPLLGKSLDGWEVFTGVPHESVSVPGFPQSTSKDGHSGTPVGLGDPLKIFSIEELDGEPVLHISGQVYAGLTTLESFSDYHVSLEYKWGEKKWAPRLERKRDSGLLIHCNGEHGAFWNVWMQCLECQIQETDAGDLYTLGGTSAMVPSVVTEGKFKKYQSEGELAPIGAGAVLSCSRSENFEFPDQWNRIDAMTVGDESLFMVNGHVVMRMSNTKIGKQSDGKPLKSGRIQIQSEAAEVFYRNIRIRPITALPLVDLIP